MAEQTNADESDSVTSIVAKINRFGYVRFNMTIDGFNCGVNLTEKGFIIYPMMDKQKTFYESKYAASADYCVAHFIDISLAFNDITGKFEVNGSFLTVKETALLTRKDPVECCVCMEPTFQKTKCGHSICRRCTYKLTEPICPLCRAEIEEENEDE